MRKSYITLCNSEKYIKGTLSLYESLNATNTEIPLVIFCPKKTPENVRMILKNYADLCINNNCKLEIYESEEDVTLPKEITDNNKWLRWNGTFDKLLVFGLAKWDKLVFVDSDMLVLKNIDHLFNFPHMSACHDGHYDKINLNSGLMVIEPTNNKSELERIVGFISEVIHNTQFGDQDIIRLAFPEWKFKDELHLSEQYNLFFENVAKRKKELNYDILNSTKNPIYIVHFIGYDKPWYKGKEIKWKIYIFVWITKMILRDFKSFKNMLLLSIWMKYRYFLRIVNYKLKKLNIQIYEMK